MNEKTLIIRGTENDIKSIKDFINGNYSEALESKDMIVSEAMEKEYWMEQLVRSYPTELEGKSFKEIREIAEKEYEEFINDEGYYYDFPPFEEWCGYVPTFNRIGDDK